MMNQHLSTGTITPDTALIPKHAGWAAARAGNEAWIIDRGNAGDENKWFTYTPDDIEQMHYVRKCYCQHLREGNIP